jgi:molybdopterin-guanine dinucleotide biosynthesis protein
MSVVKTVAIGALTAVVCYAGHEFSQSKFGTKVYLKYIRKEPIPVANLHEIPYVENPVALKTIKNGFDSKDGGIKVLYAPSGSGKTTYLANLAKEYQTKGRNVEFISCTVSKNHLYECLNIPKLSYDLSEVVPNGTIIIFDQMESVAFSEELKNMLRQVALDSRKIKNYVVIVSVSSKEVADKVLSLNGNDKISSLGNSSAFHWSHDLVSDYIENSRHYKNWNDDDKQRIVELATEAGSPAFLFNLESREDSNPSSILQDKKILASAKAYSSSWINEEE